jgi:hypothetical protein
MPTDLSIFEYSQVILVFKSHQTPHARHLVVVLKRNGVPGKLLGLEMLKKILHTTIRNNVPKEIMLPPLVMHDLEIDQQIPAGAVHGGNYLPSEIF